MKDWFIWKIIVKRKIQNMDIYNAKGKVRIFLIGRLFPIRCHVKFIKEGRENGKVPQISCHERQTVYLSLWNQQLNKSFH